jgi:predicted transcriptional regulator
MPNSSRKPKRRHQILKILRQYAEDHGGNSPTMREAAYLVGLAYTTIRFHIDHLKKEGYLDHKDGKLVITDKGREVNTDAQ